MRLSIPTSWDNRLVGEIEKVNLDSKTKMPVHEIYGTFQTTIIGGGRPSSIIPYITREKAEDHIRFAHQHGLEVNFLLNTICMGAREFIPEYHKEMLNMLGWLDDVKVDTVTITIPYLMELVRRQFPRIKICVSVTATAGTVQEIRFFIDDIGVDRINLHFMMNRDFEMIKAIHREINDFCDLEVLANDPCLFHCPYREYHQTLYAHGSQASNSELPPIIIDYPGIKCAIKRINDRAEILKSPWIRPEDTIYWEQAGVNFVKLAGRTKPTDWIIECMQYYAQRECNGDIYRFIEKSGLYAPEYDAFFTSLNPIEPLRFYINNKSLDGFIEYFIKEKPRCELGCTAVGCYHCYKWAERVVRVNENLAQKHLYHLQLILNRLTDSTFIDESIMNAIKERQYNSIGEMTLVS